MYFVPFILPLLLRIYGIIYDTVATTDIPFMIPLLRYRYSVCATVTWWLLLYVVVDTAINARCVVFMRTKAAVAWVLYQILLRKHQKMQNVLVYAG